MCAPCCTLRPLLHAVEAFSDSAARAGLTNERKQIQAWYNIRTWMTSNRASVGFKALWLNTPEASWAYQGKKANQKIPWTIIIKDQGWRWDNKRTHTHTYWDLKSSADGRQMEQEAANCSRGTFEMRHGQWKAESGSCYHEHTVQAHDADESVGKAAKWEWRVWKWTGVGGKWGRYRWCVDRLQRLKWLMEEIEPRASLPAAVFRRWPRRTLSV